MEKKKLNKRKLIIWLSIIIAIIIFGILIGISIVEGLSELLKWTISIYIFILLVGFIISWVVFKKDSWEE